MLHATPAGREAGFIFESSINIRDEPKAFRKMRVQYRGACEQGYFVFSLDQEAPFSIPGPLFQQSTLLCSYAVGYQ